MTQPTQFTATRSEEELRSDRDYLPMARAAGKLMIVRPISYQRDGYVTVHKPEGTDALFADIAVLDPIPPGVNEYNEQLPGFAAGHQFRNQVVLQGFLKGALKHHVGDTLIGTVYFGPREKGKPPIKWQDLSQNPQCVARGQSFLTARPEFLVPVEAQIVATQPAPPAPAAPPAYQQPTYGNGQQQGYAAPVPQYQQQPAPTAPPAQPWEQQGYTAPAPQYQQPAQAPQPSYNGPDPWAAGPYAAAVAAPASTPPQYQQPVSAAPAARPVTTLEQLKAAQGAMNHQGNFQSDSPPF